MQPKEADKGKEINVTIEVNSVKRIGNEVTIMISTNLPENTDMMIDFKGPNGYWSEDSQKVKNGKFQSTFGKITEKGSYKLNIITPVVSSQSDKSVKAIFGDRGKNMVGSLIVFDTISGNMVEFNQNLNIE
jgi:hypothetical protein